MANLTLKDYIELVYRYRNLDATTDGIDSDPLYTRSWVVRSINASRQELLRRIGLGLHREEIITDAVQGDFAPPASSFADAVVSFKNNDNCYKSLTVHNVVSFEQQHPNWRSDQFSSTTTVPSSIVFWPAIDGWKCRLYPALTTTVVDGLRWNFNKALEDLADDEDECPIMNLFPEYQMTTLPAGALSRMINVEAGSADSQQAKYKALFESDMEAIRAVVNGMFKSNTSWRS